MQHSTHDNDPCDSQFSTAVKKYRIELNLNTLELSNRIKPEIINLKEKFILAHVFRGFGYGWDGSIVLGSVMR
jgi:hypothetical protein